MQQKPESPRGLEIYQEDTVGLIQKSVQPGWVLTATGAKDSQDLFSVGAERWLKETGACVTMI